MSDVLGWDIGGAHLKLARVSGSVVTEVRQVPCALWQGVDRLAAAVDEALRGQPGPSAHALTMTGELADIFPDRANGVRAILAAFGRCVPGSEISVYAVAGAWLTPAEAGSAPERVASANWHATAQLVAAATRDGLLIDIGSTTTDLVPLRSGAVTARGMDDAERLALDELVYRGVVRTPVMAVAPYVEVAGRRVGIVAELFATMADVYRLTGELPTHADQHPTADGRGKSLAESRARLARMIGRDAASAPDAVWDALARHLADRQFENLREAAARLLVQAAVPAGAPVIGAGVGRFLAAAVARQLAAPYRGFDELIGARNAAIAACAADCAPAVAVALLRNGA
jgi:(4-(4-[2-(gamma-L-glutamylamino)ethyl]phenoxymethyl)furan-2-yl)methanamine synthase